MRVVAIGFTFLYKKNRAICWPCSCNSIALCSVFLSKFSGLSRSRYPMKAQQRNWISSGNSPIDPAWLHLYVPLLWSVLHLPTLPLIHVCWLWQSVCVCQYRYVHIFTIQLIQDMQIIKSQIWLDREKKIHRNPQTILRIMQKYNLLSVIQRKSIRNTDKGCTDTRICWTGTSMRTDRIRNESRISPTCCFSNSFLPDCSDILAFSFNPYNTIEKIWAIISISFLNSSGERSLQQRKDSENVKFLGTLFMRWTIDHKQGFASNTGSSSIAT